MEFLGVVLLVLGFVGFGILGKYVRERKQLQLSEMIHKERMRAMEKGIPLAEIGHEDLAEKLVQMNLNSDANPGAPGNGILWVRIYALCLGLLFFFGGIGVVCSLPFVDFEEVPLFWPLGIIPILMGLGLLLFWNLTRKYEDRIRSEK